MQLHSSTVATHAVASCVGEEPNRELISSAFFRSSDEGSFEHILLHTYTTPILEVEVCVCVHKRVEEMKVWNIKVV